MDDLKIPLPGRGEPDFQLPILVTLDGLYAASLYFDWSQETVGFGQCSIYIKDGKVIANAEGMGKEWLRRALYAAVDALVDQATLK
jgi:hypothetical protein